MNLRNWENKLTASQGRMFDLMRLKREGALIPAIPWWGSLEHDPYMDNHLYLDSIHQDIDVNQFHDGSGLNLPYGLTKE